jgi:hypothetical protein
MKRSKRLCILLGVLAVACVATFALSRYQAKKEQIQTNGEVVLEIPVDSVQALSWEYDGETLSFHKDDQWIYDEDEAFPVDGEKIEGLLNQFSAMGAAFTIENPEDLSPYGLSDPTCSITITTDEETYTILLGGYSTMDSQRYVSIGDGNVYLVADDPLDDFDIGLRDLLDPDDIPAFDQVSEITFTGSENYQIFYEAYEDGSARTYCADDVYFVQQEDGTLPLDTDKVNSYLQTIRYLDLSDYVTYNVTDEELAQYGLDDPELTIQVNYTEENEDGDEVSDTFTLHISRDPEELAKAEASESEDEEDTEEEITAYARVDDSPIVYRLYSESYSSLMRASCDDLRHAELFTADFADITQIDVSLEGTDYTITTDGSGDDRTYAYLETEVEIDDFRSALESLQADSFTDEAPAQKEEISLTLHLDNEAFPTVEISLYRYDGSSCLAVVDGVPTALVERSQVVDLIEAVNSIVLN